MKVSEVSKRYAKALMAATKQKGLHKAALSELQALSQALFADKGMRSFFANPMISSEAKVASVKAALEGQVVSEEVLNTIALLGEKGRLNILDQVAVALQGLLDSEDGLTRGVIRSAQPLSAEAQRDFEEKIRGVLKKKIVLTFEQDSKLLGGVVAHVGGWTFDDSIASHLRKMNDELNRRAN